jgi:prephenate dehydrogenase
MSDRPRTLPVIQSGAGSGAPPIFEKVAIVGLGLIGGSIALAARQTWPTGLVIGVDDREVLERAMVRHAIDIAADDPVVMAEADLVILAAPVQQNIELVAELAQHVPGRAVVTDVSSTKREVVEAARALPPRLTFVGGHPLGGAPRGGIDSARSDLFAGRPWLFTPAHDAAGDAVDRLRRFVTALGADAHVMSVVEHDRLLAFLSHLPQLVASTLMHVVGNAAGEPGLALAGRGLADTTRLASSPTTIWRDICATNTDEIGAALDAFIAELREVRGQLASGEALERVFESAIRWRATLAAQGRERPTE